MFSWNILKQKWRYFYCLDSVWKSSNTFICIACFGFVCENKSNTVGSISLLGFVCEIITNKWVYFFVLIFFVEIINKHMCYSFLSIRLLKSLKTCRSFFVFVCFRSPGLYLHILLICISE